MANITLNTALTTGWKNITDDLSLANGTTYLMDLRITGELRIGNDVAAAWAKTNNATAPTVEGHPFRVQLNDISPQARFAQNANEKIWIKLEAGSADLIVTKA